MALAAAWWVAWSAAPHGEVARQTSIVGAVAVAGGDDAALAWLELKHGSSDGTLHVVTVDSDGSVGDQLQLAAGADATAFRLADAGASAAPGGRFVLATEHRGERERIEFRRFGVGASHTPPAIDDASAVGAWQMAAAGDELVVAIDAGALTHVYVLGKDEKWRAPEEVEGRVLVGAGGGHVVYYSFGYGSDRFDHLVFAAARDAAWTADLARPSCFSDGGRPATITSVVGLRGGYARLSRRANEGCVDGIRDGGPFAFRAVPLAGFSAARLAVEENGRLSVYEDQDSQVTRRRVLLPETPGGAMVIDERSVNPLLDSVGVRYRLFGGSGRLGVTTLATRVSDHETQVVLERSGQVPESRVLAPVRSYQPDHRPVLRRLAAVPLALLALALLAAGRLRLRLRGLVPLAADAPLRDGRTVIEGELAADAEAPAGGLRVRRGRSLLTLFLEGAEVLRASDVRPRSQPRGDAVDVASGATVVASGTVEPEHLYRGESTLRARRGDLVLVGCTLAEARARIAARFYSSAILFGLTSAALLSLALAG